MTQSDNPYEQSVLDLLGMTAEEYERYIWEDMGVVVPDEPQAREGS